MATTSASSTSSDQEKFLAAKLIARSQMKLVCASICEKETQPKGTGATAYFVRYDRMYVPTSTLTEGTDPTAQAVAVTQFSVTLDQWGAIIEITDLAEIETKHPLVQQCIELLSENAQRVIDREVQVVWLAGTNIQYGDASVTARASVTASMKISDSVIHKAVVTLVDGGAPARGGPSGGMAVEKGSESSGSINQGNAYVGVAGPHVIRDIMTASASMGSFAAVSMYNNAKALYNAEVGTWLGVRWVESNFIPKFVLLGNKTTAVASAASAGITGMVITAVTTGGSLTSSTTYYYKITRKDLLRGFEEAISIEHTTSSTSSGDNESFTFAFPSTAGYVYNVYFGSATGNSNLKIHATQNNAASATLTVTAVPSTTTTAPENIRASDDADDPTTIHPVYIHGAESCSWVGLQNLSTHITEDKSTPTNVLQLKKWIGYKFMAKAMIRDQARMIRCEVASTFG